MKLIIEVSQMSIDGNVSGWMLQVNHISIAIGRDFDPMYPAICSCIDGFSLYTTKLIIQSCVKVIGTEFCEITGKVVSPTGLDGRAKIVPNDSLRKRIRKREKK
jgi:hypothetical protein